MMRTKLYRVILPVLLSLLLFSCFGIAVSAASPFLTDYPDVQREEYRRLIDEAFAQDQYKVTPSLFQFCEDYRIDFDTVIVEYELEDSRLDGWVNEGEGELIPIEYGVDHPIFYLPVYGKFDGTERIFGHVVFRYYSVEERYVAGAYCMTTDEQGELYVFATGDRQHFIEKLLTAPGIAAMAAETGIGTVEETVLVRYDRAGTDVTDKVLLLRTETGVYVWDLSGSAHSTEGKEVYPLSEYNTYRDAHLDEQTRSWISDLVGALAIGFVKVAAVFFILMAVSVILFVVMVILIVRKLRAKKRGVNNSAAQ